MISTSDFDKLADRVSQLEDEYMALPMSREAAQKLLREYLALVFESYNLTETEYNAELQRRTKILYDKIGQHDS